MIRRLTMIAAAALAALSVARAGEATPLFDDDAVIEIKLTGPIQEIARTAEKSTDPHPGTLELTGETGETHAIELSARGLSRRVRSTCQFPPLRVRFVEKPGDGSLFEKQRVLKLVTHCRASKSFQQYALLEYSAYRLYNVVTPLSYRVRLANIQYVDSKSGKTVAARAGFFIEDTDDLARRVDLKEIKRVEILGGQLDPIPSADAALFQYMIGNLDWDMRYGPTGENCCHNGKVLGPSEDAANAIVVAPYDFDYSGLVDAPYAAPPDQLPVSNVRTRLYRGYCLHNAVVAEEAARYRALKARLMATVGETPGISKSRRTKAERYLGGFFESIATDALVQQKLLKKCRG